MSIKTAFRIASQDIVNNRVLLGANIIASELTFELIWTQSNYNIITSSLLRVTIAAVDYDIYVPTGYYTPAALATNLQTQLQILVPTMTVTIDTATRKTTITNTAIFTINSLASNSNLLQIIGYVPGATYAGNLSYTSDNITVGYLGVGMYLDIQGLQFVTDISNNSNSVNLTPLIVPWASFGDVATWTPGYQVVYKSDVNKTIQGLAIKFKDFSGNTLNFNGGSWVLNIYTN